MYKYIPDLSAIKSGALTKLVEEGRVSGEILIHRGMITEFERRASMGDFMGLNEIKRLRDAALKHNVAIKLIGRSKISMLEDLNARIRNSAAIIDGVLVTCDYVSAKTAEALGIKVLYEKPKGRLKLEEFFDNEDVMSVHIKEGMPPRVKRGAPGKWIFETVREWPFNRSELEDLVEEILERARTFEDGFIEADREGSTIVQLGSYRIVITRPPFSDGLELTAVRPIAKLELEDYALPKKLIDRLEAQAEGILIAGAPGMGKTTFAQALAEFYLRKGKVVKTVEAPRDLQLPCEVTQYSKAKGTSEEIHDVLLLSRPDYTIFDEMRDTEDFKLFADLRLAGVGMVGVVHATTPIDAIQRFVGRVELGMIPSVIDTVIFIKDGAVKKVYAIETTIKVPHGLKEADLARPVVVVNDFLTEEPEYELYVFGEKTFVVPVKKAVKGAEAARRVVENIVRRYAPEYRVEIDERGTAMIYVPKSYASIVMKRCRKKLMKAGKGFGINEVEVYPMLEEY
ncbi:MAG: ATPase [Thermoprotei archaeon]|nr:MAG: ATPase [Thermoprotei archaeon]RLF15002.1 MAG: ATPase [Thermoprotei archaeon]